MYLEPLPGVNGWVFNGLAIASASAWVYERCTRCRVNAVLKTTLSFLSIDFWTHNLRKSVIELQAVSLPEGWWSACMKKIDQSKEDSFVGRLAALIYLLVKVDDNCDAMWTCFDVAKLCWLWEWMGVQLNSCLAYLRHCNRDAELALVMDFIIMRPPPGLPGLLPWNVAYYKFTLRCSIQLGSRQAGVSPVHARFQSLSTNLIAVLFT